MIAPVYLQTLRNPSRPSWMSQVLKMALWRRSSGGKGLTSPASSSRSWKPPSRETATQTWAQEKRLLCGPTSLRLGSGWVHTHTHTHSRSYLIGIGNRVLYVFCLFLCYISYIKTRKRVWILQEHWVNLNYRTFKKKRSACQSVRHWTVSRGAFNMTLDCVDCVTVVIWGRQIFLLWKYDTVALGDLTSTKAYITKSGLTEGSRLYIHIMISTHVWSRLIILDYKRVYSPLCGILAYFLIHSKT